MANRPRDWGDQFPSDIGDTPPTSPLENLDEGASIEPAGKKFSFGNIGSFSPGIEAEPEHPAATKTFVGVVIRKLTSGPPATYKILTHIGTVVVAQFLTNLDSERVGSAQPVIVVSGNHPEEYFAVGVFQASEGRSWWVKAQENWEYDPEPPSFAGGIAKVKVRLCEDYKGNGEHGAEFYVRLPVAAGCDPNVVSGQVFKANTMPDGEWSAQGLDDAHIGAVRGHVGLISHIPQGWKMMDGVENSIDSGGSSYSAKGAGGRFLRFSGADDETGETAGFSFHNHTGVTQYATIDISMDLAYTDITIEDHPATGTFIELTGITVDPHPASVTDPEVTNLSVDDHVEFQTELAESDITISDHEDHAHASGTEGYAAAGSDINVPKLCSDGTSDTGTCGASQALYHNIADNSHQHDIDSLVHTTDELEHFHGIPELLHNVQEGLGHGHGIAAVGHTLHDPGHVHNAYASSYHRHGIVYDEHIPPYLRVVFIERVNNSKTFADGLGGP